MRTPIVGPIQLSVADVTSERIVSLYLYGQEMLPTALYDRLRPVGEQPVTVEIDTVDWFQNGGGRFVNPARFDAISKGAGLDVRDI